MTNGGGFGTDEISRRFEVEGVHSSGSGSSLPWQSRRASEAHEALESDGGVRNRSRSRDS